MAVFFSTAFARLHTTYYDKDKTQIHREINYKNDTYNMRHGLYTEWYENGQIYKEVNYKNGRHHGLVTVWEEDGQVRRQSCYVNNKYVDKSNCGI